MKFHLKTLFVVTTLMFLLLPHLLFASESARSITVTGHSEMTIQPNHSKIRAQLKIVSQTIEESYNRVTNEVKELAIRLQRLGLSKNDLTVSTITQGAEYEWRNNSRVLKGYYSACSLLIKINNIEDTYKVHSALSKSTSLTIGSTQYDRDDKPLLKTAALQDALKEAAIKAQAMAETLGATLGKVIMIQEGGMVVSPQPVAETMRMATASEIDDVVTTGSLTIQGDVVVQFELK